MLKTEFKIGKCTIGGEAKPCIIAEIGSNFNRNKYRAKELIDVAAKAGASAVKFQLFQADLLYPEGGRMFDIFKSVELNADWVPELLLHAGERGIEFIASAFDRNSVHILDQAGVKAFKVASSETTNLQLLHNIAVRRKPMIISTGMCDMVDVEEAVKICESAGNSEVGLLQCGSIYPLPPELANLKVMDVFHERFGCPVGFSDHTLGHTAAICSVGLGAHIIEKHFTFDRSAEGPDHFYALEPHELAAYVAGIRQAYATLGSREKDLLPKEREIGRREGLYFARKLSAGETIAERDITVHSPAIGMRARYRRNVVGAHLCKPVGKGTPISWDVLSL